MWHFPTADAVWNRDEGALFIAVDSEAASADFSAVCDVALRAGVGDIGEPDWDRETEVWVWALDVVSTALTGLDCCHPAVRRPLDAPGLRSLFLSRDRRAGQGFFHALVLLAPLDPP